jgi:hypothetical protein
VLLQVDDGGAAFAFRNDFGCRNRCTAAVKLRLVSNKQQQGLCPVFFFEGCRGSSRWFSLVVSLMRALACWRTTVVASQRRHQLVHAETPAPQAAQTPGHGPQ